MSGTQKNKLTEEQIRYMLDHIKDSPTQIARVLGIDHSTVYYYRERYNTGRVIGKVGRPRGKVIKRFYVPTEKINKGKNCYADYLKEENDKKTKRLFK